MYSVIIALFQISRKMISGISGGFYYDAPTELPYNKYLITFFGENVTENPFSIPAISTFS